jgi:hypothetical protein
MDHIHELIPDCGLFQVHIPWIYGVNMSWWGGNMEKGGFKSARMHMHLASTCRLTTKLHYRLSQSAAVVE